MWWQIWFLFLAIAGILGGAYALATVNRNAFIAALMLAIVGITGYEFHLNRDVG